MSRTTTTDAMGTTLRPGDAVRIALGGGRDLFAIVRDCCGAERVTVLVDDDTSAHHGKLLKASTSAVFVR